MEVCLPGTGGMIPRHDRYLSCCYMLHNKSAVLIDCGEGTQIALAQARCRLSRLDLLLITHFHADHVAGLPGLLLSLGNCGKCTPLTIAGPIGLTKVVSALLTIAPVLPYPLHPVELDVKQPQQLSLGDMRIDALLLNHSVPCLAYRISVIRKPIFNPKKAQNLAVPISMYRTLHAGQCLTLSDGRQVTTDMVTDGLRLPVRICYATDTLPVPGLLPFVQGADLLICEGMYGDETMRSKANKRMHMLFTDSARLAKSAKVKQLWLTHYSPSLNDPNAYLPLIRQIFPQTDAAFDGIRATL